MNDVPAAVRFVYDAIQRPEEALQREDMGGLHTALAPHLRNWMESQGTLKRSVSMVSAVGSVNYGTVVESSDLDMKAVYMPTLEDLFHDRCPKFSFVTDEFDCELHPAHHFCKHVLKGNINFFEFLYARGGACLAEPDFIYVMKSLLTPLVEMNVVLTCMASYFTALQQDKGIGYGTPGEPWSHKKASHAIRILAFLIELIDTGKFNIVTAEPFRAPVIRLKTGEMQWPEYRELFAEMQDTAKGMLFKRWVDGGNYEHTDRVLALDGTNTPEWTALRAELDRELIKQIRWPIELAYQRQLQEQGWRS